MEELAELVGGGTTIIPTAKLPTDEEAAKLEDLVSVKFPRDYKAFLRVAGSLLSTVKEDIWPRPKIGSVGPHWLQTRYQLRVFGVCAEVDWLRIEVEAEAFRAAEQTTLVPVFAWENSPERICFSSDGSLVAFSSESGAKRLGESFETALRRLLAEQRKFKEELLKTP